MPRIAMRLVIEPTTRRLAGELSIPHSKYHAHRALMLASLADGESTIVGLTHARHVRYTIDLLRALGTRIDLRGDAFVVRGGPYRPRRRIVSAGSSGTTLYFIIGLASLATAPVQIVAQRHFQRRPVGPLLGALRDLGIRLTSQNDCPPIVVEPSRPRGGTIRISGTLSQWISGLLLVAPFASSHTTILVEGELNERPYVALTVRMMEAFGLHVDVAADWRRFDVAPNQRPHAANVTLPPDVSSAAFGLAVTALHPSDVVFKNLTSLDHARKEHPEGRFLDIIREMGLPLGYDDGSRAIRTQHDGIRLRGMTVDCREMPDMLPILCALGTFASGRTVLRNVGHVRLKESDRVAAMAQLNHAGGRVFLQGNDMAIEGVHHIEGADLSSHNDHRVLMSLAIAATRAAGVTQLTYPNAFRISYPEFLNQMNGIGAQMSVEPSVRSVREELQTAK